jgi:hypothetical protein
VSCACGVRRCTVHGHVEGGEDPRCPWLIWDPTDPDQERLTFEDLDLSTWEER